MQVVPEALPRVFGRIYQDVIPGDEVAATSKAKNAYAADPNDVLETIISMSQVRTASLSKAVERSVEQKRVSGENLARIRANHRVLTEFGKNYHGFCEEGYATTSNEYLMGSNQTIAIIRRLDSGVGGHPEVKFAAGVASCLSRIPVDEELRKNALVVFKNAKNGRTIREPTEKHLSLFASGFANYQRRQMEMGLR